MKRQFLVLLLPLLSLPMANVEAAAPAGTLSGATISFSGRSWAVKSSTQPVGPGPNVFSGSAENVWVDSGGQLTCARRTGMVSGGPPR